MLTKDLLRARVSRGLARPSFVRPDDTAWLELAEELLLLYRGDPPPTRGELDEAAGPLVNGARDVRLAKGLEKLLRDRCEFAVPREQDYPALRRQLFAASTAGLREAAGLSVEEYTAKVRTLAACPPEFLAEDIYLDLPENERLQGFRELSARELLERYNVGLVQGLLLGADALELHVAAADSAHLRRLCKYLKFFRLLATIEREEPAPARGRKAAPAPTAPDSEPQALRARIDGPASILDSSRKYGLQLASFFPAVCALERWSLVADVEWRGGKVRLELDQKTGLVSHYRNFGAYLPEEIKVFHRVFAESTREWNIVGETPFLDGGGQELLFPDLSFRGPGGEIVHLELFHRWHAGPLPRRLDWLAAHPQMPLALGIDRAVQANPAIAARLESDPLFARRTFLFRDFPTPTAVRKCLENTAADLAGTPLLDS